jgi:16S rRNA (uracil1498-N3)-methyltransferase
VGHRPHLYLPPPWTGPTVELSNNQRHHLLSVLRLQEAEELSYTDGAGLLGIGHLQGGSVVRSAEERRPAPRPHLTLAVAPPSDKDRARFLVEKAAELEVARIVWLATRYGQGHPPPLSKAIAWAVAGLEQSQGAHLLGIEPALMSPDQLESQSWSGETWLTVGDGGPLPDEAREIITVAIGPEGGWAPEELSLGLPRIGLGRTTLRVETAALTIAALLMRA